MKQLLTPKQVARSIDASESSVKRWCDKGLIPTQYTAGGHRRIAMADLVEFLRTTEHELRHPEALGLSPTSGQTARVVERARDQMTEALLAGQAATCRQIAMDMYLARHSVSAICDNVLAAAFQQIGDRWACGRAEIYQERRGCEITLRILHELRSILPPVTNNAPLAIGGAASGDQYCLGTTMAELVLREAKWKAVSLGDNLPFETIAVAIREHQPALFWLSVSHVVNERDFLSSYGELQEEFGTKAAFVVGGFALTERIRKKMKYSAYCDNMQHLEAFSQTLRSALVK